MFQFANTKSTVLLLIRNGEKFQSSIFVKVVLVF